MASEDPPVRDKMTWREYPKEMRKSIDVYAWVWNSLITRAAKRFSALSTIGTAVSVACGLVGTWFVRKILDGAATSLTGAMAASAIWYAGFVLLDEFAHWWVMHWREMALGDNMIQLDRETSRLFFEKSLGQHLAQSGSLSAANVEKGRARVQEVQNMMLFDGVPVLLRLFGAWIALWILSPIVGLMASGIFVMYGFYLFMMNSRITRVCEPIDAAIRAANKQRVAKWEHIERVKTNGKETEETRVIGDRIEKIIVDTDRPFWLSAIRVFATRGIFGALIVLAILDFGAHRVAGGVWPLGLLFPLYVWLMSVKDNVWQIAHIEHRLNVNMPSVGSMRRALTMAPDVVDVPNAIELRPDRPPRIAFEHVGFTYRQTSEESVAAGTALSVLDDISFVIEPGEHVAVIGPSGVGKTTVMRLLQRAFDPDQGRITVDGHDLREVRLGSWERLLGNIPQKPQIFDGTLRENLLYDLPEAERSSVDDARLWEIMQALQCDFGARLVHGLDTRVGRNGIQLSGGQAQRIMIAAAVIKRPLVMLIDEATSSLDSTTEKGVQKGLAAALAGQHISTITIAHRLSTVRDRTKFIVMRPSDAVPPGETQVEAIGSSFEELNVISPTFRRLAADQDIVIQARLVPAIQ